MTDQIREAERIGHSIARSTTQAIARTGAVTAFVGVLTLIYLYSLKFYKELPEGF